MYELLSHSGLFIHISYTTALKCIRNMYAQGPRGLAPEDEGVYNPYTPRRRGIPNIVCALIFQGFYFLGFCIFKG